MKLYLTRHGQVPSNVIGRFNLKEEDLTEIGVEQAKKLYKIVENIEYDVIISSPFLRAVHTAELINAKKRPIIIDERLRERDSGSLAGRNLNVVDREEYWNYYKDGSFADEESVKDFFVRIEDFIKDLKAKNYQSVLIVSHSGVSKAFGAFFEGIGDGKFLHRGIANCEIKEYTL